MSHPSPETPDTRILAHTRTIVCNSYLRTDGLWDVEARVEDCKHYEFSMLERGPFSPGTPYHSIAVTLTVDRRLKIVEASAAMDAHPFDDCREAIAPARKLVGATLGRGWRKAVDEAVGGTVGCTHMREMLYAIASSAIQAIPGYERQFGGKGWPDLDASPEKAPGFIDGCRSWRVDGPVVLRYFPQFSKEKR